MSKDLTVGSAGLVGLEDSMMAHLEGTGIKRNLKKWRADPDDFATISCLNGASVLEFLRHVAHCEGYSDDFAGFAAFESGKSRYRNVPWWENSIWLPDRAGAFWKP